MFACIFIPDFSVQAIIRFEPELCARPVAVLTGRPPLEKVVALNERARRSGVEVGATKSQLEAWENLVLRARSESQEASAHAALLDCAQSFSPEVEDTSPGIVLLNLAGLKPLLGPLPKIARDLARHVSQMGLEANIAVAANPDAALLAPRGFPGVTLIPEGCEAERLGDLPVDVLLESFSSSFSFDVEQAARWVETFDRWGIRKLRALAALPEVPVSERLGQQGIRLQKLARGAASRNLRVLEPRLIFAESVELEYPIVLLEPLAFLLNRMLEQVCARLRARALAAQELHLNLELAAAPPNDRESFTRTFTRTQKFTRTLRLPTPMLDAKVFLKLLQLDLQAHPPGAPIVKIRVKVRVTSLGTVEVDDSPSSRCIAASSSSSCSSCAANARALNRAHTCSSIRLSKNASGSSRTMGYSNSTLSAKISRGSNKRKSRDAAPRANFCRRSPCCPRRSMIGTSGKAASARSLRMPQRSNVSTQRVACSASKEKVSSNTSTGRSPSRSASRPPGIKVTPGKPRPASNAASGFAATAMFASSPTCETRCAKSRAIFGSVPSNGASPARFRSAVPGDVSSTSGEKACAQSSSAAWAEASWDSERVRNARFSQASSCDLVTPASTPNWRARSLSAITFSSGGRPLSIATGRARNSGSKRMIA